MRFADHARAYDPRAEAGGLAAEAARLEAQAGLSWPREREILARLIRTPLPRILEVGSGSGAVTARLLADFPDAEITALEPDTDLLGLSAERVGASPRLSLVHGSIDHNTLPDGGFDLVVLRYVLQHLADPVAAVRALGGKLAPGGRLAVIDVDGGLWGAAEPTDPSLAPLHAAAATTQAGRGGDRLVGRRLWSILLAAGYPSPKLEVFCYHSGELGLAAFAPQLGPERLLPAVTAGDLAFEDYLKLVEADRRFLNDPKAFVLMLGFVCSGGRR
ncbi:hypothetical protein BH10PSE4_BH10PSE4_03350 [soil metagenome]